MTRYVDGQSLPFNMENIDVQQQSYFEFPDGEAESGETLYLLSNNSTNDGKPQIPGGGFQNGKRPQMPDGGFSDGEMPQRPDDGFPAVDAPQMPNGDSANGEMPQRPDDGLIDGEMPQLPDGGPTDRAPPQMPDGDFTEDEMPQIPDDDFMRGGGGRGGEQFMQWEQNQDWAQGNTPSNTSALSAGTLLPVGISVLFLLAGILIAWKTKH